MNKNILPMTLLAAAGIAAGPATAAAAPRAIDGDADVTGSHVRLEAETTMSAQRVTFIYGGKRYKGHLTETDREDATKDWGRTVKALKSDRKPGRTVKFRVRACDASGCTTTRFKDIVEWDD